MRKLTFLLVSILTSVAPAAWAAGGPVPAIDVEGEAIPPGPDGPYTQGQEHRHVAARRFNRAELREEIAADRREERAASVPPHLQAIAQCESGGDPGAVGGGGQFRGKYQFTYATWAAVGGQGDPATAPEAEQDRRAAALYSQSGPGQWPVCGG